MKVAMITGSCPPDACGVGDYTFRLVQALSKSGADIEIITKQSWKLTNIRKLAREVSSVSPDLIHIQYPTVGYGSDLGPQILSLLSFPCVVTLHEVSQAHILRRLAMYPFAMDSNALIFTSQFERDYAIKWAPWIVNRSTIIPIGSFISANEREVEKDIREITYFGLIRPNKGIEDVIALGELIRSCSLELSIQIIGAPDPRCHDYFQHLRESSIGLPITWKIGLPEMEVAELLARSQVAYVPFPDGASERRSSLLALLSNGVATITTEGMFTTDDMREVVEFAQTPEEALRIIQKLSLDNDRWIKLINKSRDYAKRYSWNDIALKHLVVYRDVLNDK